MSEYKDIVKVAIDAHHGNVEKYSANQSQELLREALIEANGGSTIVDYRAMRDGKCNGVFEILEEILQKTVVEDLTDNDFFMSLVDFRNIALGDENRFNVEDDDLFYVAEIAEGTQGIRRQRLSGTSQISINTSLRAVKIYEELNRVLAGRVDFNDMINKVGKSMKKNLLDEIYAVWAGATAADFGGTTYFPAAASSYDEDQLLDLVEHVEAASGGKQVTLLGTKKAVRNLIPSVQGVDSKSDIYNLGYYSMFYGSPVVVMPQRHKLNTTNFIFPDDVIYIMATEEKPIKCVYEGDGLIIPGDPLTNGDLTQEYLYAERYGIGIITAGGNSGIGRYEF